MFSFFQRKPKPRSAIDGASVAVLLTHALRGKAPNYRHLGQKLSTSVITLEDVEKAAAKSYAPWREGAWECEDQARSLVETAQRRAANEGRSWALGTVRADALIGRDQHVYVWAIVHKVGRFSERDVVFYDPTLCRWLGADQIRNADYTLT